MNKFLLLLLPVILFAEPTGIERLIEGNRRFVSGDIKHTNRTAERREEVSASQNPYAVIVCCSDSRLPPELIFDEGMGDLFVIRVAGNVIGSLSLETIKYAVAHLKSQTVVVMGHSNCGAVDATLNGITQDIPDIAFLIEPSLRPGNLEASIKANAMRMADFVRKQDFIQKNNAQVYSAHYDLRTGEVLFFDKSPTAQ